MINIGSEKSSSILLLSLLKKNMLKTAIIIGFDYSNLLLTYLPGIPIDLYSIYTVAKKSKPDRIVVITDINNDYHTTALSDAIVDEIVDSDVTGFIKRVKKENHHHQFIDLSDFRNTLREYSTGSDQVFFYYTGHAKDGDFLLPNGEMIKTSEVRDIFRECTSSTSDIFAMIDCCHADGFSLPYRLTPHRGNYRYRLSTGANEFPSQRIICFSSSSPDEKSVATKRGSIFTRKFCKMLEDKNRNISNLLASVSESQMKSHQQTMTVHSSYPDTSLLWSWLYNKSLDVSLSPIDCCMKVRRYLSDRVGQVT